MYQIKQKRIVGYENLISKHKEKFKDEFKCCFCENKHEDLEYTPTDSKNPLVLYYKDNPNIAYPEREIQQFKISNSCGFAEIKTMHEMKQDILKWYHTKKIISSQR